MRQLAGEITRRIHDGPDIYQGTTATPIRWNFLLSIIS
jgi:hypothetical protein